MTEVQIFAPATVANVAVGFDILGFAFGPVGDRITLKTLPRPEVRISRIENSSEPIPTDPAKNTATVGLLQLIQDRGLSTGFEISIQKGIPLGSGMGGSAASAAGAIFGANELLGRPLSSEQMLKYALMGEQMASGAAHPDNVAPCLFGGLTLIQSVSPLEVIRLPVPPGLSAIVAHPEIKLETRRSRAVLSPTLPLGIAVRQSALLASFVSALYEVDFGRISRSLHDVAIEPQRAALIPGFAEVKKAALDQGALGSSISGSGPSVFAWAEDSRAEAVLQAMKKAFLAAGVHKVDAWRAPIGGEGVRRIP